MTSEMRIRALIDMVERLQAAREANDELWQGQEIAGLWGLSVHNLRMSLKTLSARELEQRDREHKRLVWSVGGIVAVAAVIIGPYVYRALA